MAAKKKTAAKKNPEKKTAAAAIEAVERWPISKLKPHAQNSRTHSDEQVAQLVASIEEFGFTVPVLVDDKGVILAGHGRVLAAEKRGMDMVPVLVARGWSADRKRAYIIADNRIAENGGWDKKKLGAELGSLQLADFDMTVLGFAPGEIRALVANASAIGADPDEAPPAPAAPVSQLGDLWRCGDHRVLCGDATSRAAVDRLLAGAKPHLMVTDPPYGVNYDPSWRDKAGVGSKGLARGKVKNDDRADWREAWFLFPGTVCYVWHGGLHGAEVEESLRAAKFLPRAQIIWVKSSLIMGRGDFHWRHEPAFYAQKQGELEDHWRFDEDHAVADYAVKVGNKAEWAGGRKQSTVWEIPVVKNDTGHGTQKPVECMRRPIVNNSKGGEAVYDPFLGSGTTLIAAEMEGRRCFGLELDPIYCDVIVERWATFRGGVPVQEATGKTFAETKAERHGKKTGRGT